MRRSNAVSAPSGQSSRRRVAGSAASSLPGIAPAAWRGGRPGAAGQGAARGRAAGCAAPEASRRNRPGAGSGRHAAGAAGSPSSSVSQSSSESIRRQVTPSARQWWMRITSAGAAVRERARDVDAPERPRVIEALGHHASGQSHELGAVAYPGGGANVVAHVEVGVVHPGRGGEPQRSRRQALPGAREPLKPRLDQPAHTLHGQRLPVAARLDDRQLQRVAGDRLGLEPQDPGVVRAQSFHRGLPNYRPPGLSFRGSWGVSQRTFDQCWSIRKTSFGSSIRQNWTHAWPLTNLPYPCSSVWIRNFCLCRFPSHLKVTGWL